MKKLIVFFFSFTLIFQQTGFAQMAGQFDLSGKMAQMYFGQQDRFRPLQLRYLSFDGISDKLDLLIDKGDTKKASALQEDAQKLTNYFFIGVSLPNDSIWVNLRPDSPDEMIDEYLGRTDMGKAMLEADLQLKKDTAYYTSPETQEGKEYWDRLYRKAEEIYGSTDVTIPTLNRPWIVPDEIVLREARGSAYIYKATLKVMLEQDYLKNSRGYNFADERQRQLNEYSAQLMRELVLPRLDKEINSAKRYAELRSIYYSLILSHWFKKRFGGGVGTCASLANTRSLEKLTSKKAWNKETYFRAYQKSFREGEYNIKQSLSTPSGTAVRNYFSGGIVPLGAELESALNKPNAKIQAAEDIKAAIMDNDRTVAMTLRGGPGGNLQNGNFNSRRDGGRAEDAESARRLKAENDRNGLTAFMEKHKQKSEERSLTRIAAWADGRDPDRAAQRLRDENERNGLAKFKREHEQRDGGSAAIEWTPEIVAGVKAVADMVVADTALRVYRARNFDEARAYEQMENVRALVQARVEEIEQDADLKLWASQNPMARPLTVPGVVEAFRANPQEIVDELVNYFSSMNFHMRITQAIMANNGNNAWQADSFYQFSDRARAVEQKAGDAEKAPQKPGGIDFRALPINYQPVTDSLIKLIGNVPAGSIGNLDSELKQLRKSLKMGRIPSTQRIKEYLAACYTKGELSDRADAVIACIGEIMRIQEEQYVRTEQVLKDMLALLESYQKA
ncbi:MAG: hypothetical protein ACM3OC_10215 [Deltaproteobacteria bacterium]